ncbi:hypothetical protein N0V84_011775 [Fusarium piperis]|uniref:Uncharacterized protein n=1 Tax=Fusarium piperis TaxID=1435070 RepID=A0A9W8TCW9_9HYPO|nr:hypothetical protein N0V84_011775 [Fusarium piperis]
MMHPLFGMQPAGSLPVAYPYDPMVDDHSRQMACSQAARRFSRGSNGQRSGGAMRVVKPTSASNSPRSSGVMARRKTLMNDGNSQRRRQQVLDQLSMFYDTEQQQPAQRSSRPVSWHPSSYGQQPQVQAQQPMYALTSSNMYANQQDTYGYPHVSPMLASTSCDTSPLAFSHLSLPYQTADNLPYYPYQGTSMAQHSPASYSVMDTRQVSTEASAPTDNTAYGNGWDWNTFIMHGFNATTPPTPEALPQAELSQPAVSDDIPYQALEEPLEEEGEILVGMGLYDAPDKYEEDPQLNNYRSTVSSLLGSTFRGNEPRGKGLKLEETWEPPKSDEEDEEDDEETGQEATKTSSI